MTSIYGVIYDNVTKAKITTATASCPGMTVSNNSGAYNMPCQTGTYTITASAANYTPVSTPVTVLMNQVKRQDFYLNPSA